MSKSFAALLVTALVARTLNRVLRFWDSMLVDCGNPLPQAWIVPGVFPDPQILESFIPSATREQDDLAHLECPHPNVVAGPLYRHWCAGRFRQHIGPQIQFQSPGNIVHVHQRQARRSYGRVALQLD